VLNEELMARVLEPGNLQAAYEHVKATGGAAGVDGMSVEAYAEHAARHWPVIEAKLRSGDYRPGAIRGVNIPKPQGGERRLGIPNVQDRVIQQALLQVLSPIFEVEFSGYSYGYRPGRSAHEAVEAARGYVLEGKDWVVDLDISAFFDEVDHDILMTQVGRKVRDKRVLKLIGRYLRAPIQQDGSTEQRRQGTPQGGPFTPWTQSITFARLCRIGLPGRFRRPWIVAWWRWMARDRMLDRNRIFSHDDLFDEQFHDPLTLTNVEGLSLWAQAVQKGGERFRQP
jgi:RNA-directed DNA polymerase